VDGRALVTWPRRRGHVTSNGAGFHARQQAEAALSIATLMGNGAHAPVREQTGRARIMQWTLRYQSWVGAQE
jgi:hypothetical protein